MGGTSSYGGTEPRLTASSTLAICVAKATGPDRRHGFVTETVVTNGPGKSQPDVVASNEVTTPTSPSVTDAGAGHARVESFPAIADYAFLSDCENSCLAAPNGSVEWFCLPGPDSPSLFGALLDRTAGNFRFGPTGTQVPHHRRYIPGTMALETTWHTPSGWLVVQDLLGVQQTEDGQRGTDYRHAPGDTAPPRRSPTSR